MASDHYVVSVILPTRASEITDTLRRAMDGQTRKADEVIISPDPRRNGASWARNRGFGRSRGDLVAFLDDDCIPEPDWLERLISAIEKYKAAAAGGTYIETDSLLLDRREKKGFPQTEQIDTEGMVAAGGNIMYRRDWLNRRIAKDGFLFNEKMITGEDHELAWRLTSLGATFVFVPTNHLHLRKVGFVEYQKWQFVRGRGIAQWERVIRDFKITPPRRKSILWNANGLRHAPIAVARSLLFKALGPFDFHNFSSMRNFTFYWLGEKSLGLGYVWEKLKQWFHFI